MANHKSDPLLLHPILHPRLAGILAEVKKNLPAGWKTGTAAEGIHRTPAEQFAIFQKGRAFQNGSWIVVDKSKKVTNLDGYQKNRATIIFRRQQSTLFFSNPTARNWRRDHRNKRLARARPNTGWIGEEIGAGGRTCRTSRFP